MARSIQAWQRALGSAAAGGAVLEIGALIGSVVPAAPARSILNAAAGPRGMPLETSLLREVALRYAAAGVSAWGVWVHEDDAIAGAALASAGLSIDSRPTAMAMDLAELAAAPACVGDDMIVERTADLDVIAQPLSAGYGFPAALLASGLPRLLDHVEASVARIGGLPAAAAVVVRRGGDAGVFMVATAPELRGRGAAAAVVHHALVHARDRGCTTSTLQSSAAGRSVYARLGYADLGTYLLWEHR